MTAKQFQEYLKSIHACGKARKWAHGKTDAQAWEECQRADWLMYWLWGGGIDIARIETRMLEHDIPRFCCSDRYCHFNGYCWHKRTYSKRICDQIRKHFKRPTLKARKKAAA